MRHERKERRGRGASPVTDERRSDRGCSVVRMQWLFGVSDSGRIHPPPRPGPSRLLRLLAPPGLRVELDARESVQVRVRGHEASAGQRGRRIDERVAGREPVRDRQQRRFQRERPIRHNADTTPQERRVGGGAILVGVAQGLPMHFELNDGRDDHLLHMVDVRGHDLGQRLVREPRDPGARVEDDACQRSWSRWSAVGAPRAVPRRSSALTVGTRRTTRPRATASKVWPGRQPRRSRSSTGSCTVPRSVIRTARIGSPLHPS